MTLLLISLAQRGNGANRFLGYIDLNRQTIQASEIGHKTAYKSCAFNGASWSYTRMVMRFLNNVIGPFGNIIVVVGGIMHATQQRTTSAIDCHAF